MFSKNDMQPELIKLSKYMMDHFYMVQDCVKSYPIGISALFVFNSIFCLWLFFSGQFSCLKLHFIFKRETFYHMVETFLPSIIIVIASWVSFWLHPDQAPARMSLAVTTMLTIFSQGNHVKSGLPPLSGLKVYGTDCDIEQLTTVSPVQNLNFIAFLLTNKRIFRTNINYQIYVSFVIFCIPSKRRISKKNASPQKSILKILS